MQDNGERLLRFHVLYSAVLKQEFDREEFVADDLYAFQALERALRSGNQELRNVALHLQAQRQSEMESITVNAPDKLDSTRRMPSMSVGAMEQARQALQADGMHAEGAQTQEAQGQAQAEDTIDTSSMADDEVTLELVGSDSAATGDDGQPTGEAPAGGERRSGNGQRLSPQEITRVTYLQRLYRQEFGRPLNVARFTMDDTYGREVLKEALGAENQELVALARHFIDENGKPRQHRRGMTTAA